MTVDTGLGRDKAIGLLGVPSGVLTFALTLLFPGAVIESLPDGAPNRFGVAGWIWVGPSLVPGLLLLDMAEAGRRGGGMLLSALKKLDRRLVLLPAGDEGSWERLSIVRSDNEGRDFRGVPCSGSLLMAKSCSASSSREPSLDPALEEALEDERNPSKLPNASSLPVLAAGVCGTLAWRDGGLANGLLNTGASLGAGAVRGGPMLGIPLTRRFAVVVAVDGVLDRASEVLEAFFCSVVVVVVG